MAAFSTILLTGILLLAQGDPSIQARDTLNKGVAAFNTGNYESAIEFFKQAVEKDPNLQTAELFLATAYAQRFVPGVETRENLRVCRQGNRVVQTHTATASR
jgi:tetratricopeptide (TPR) repeat protein